jgi:hypothetical protein
VADLKRHSPLDYHYLSPQPGKTLSFQNAGTAWTPGKPAVSPSEGGGGGGSAVVGDARAGSSYSAPFLAVSLELPGVGLSVVGAVSELMYVYAEGIHLQLSRGWVSDKLGVTVGAVQVGVTPRDGTRMHSAWGITKLYEI